VAAPLTGAAACALALWQGVDVTDLRPATAEAIAGHVRQGVPQRR